MARSRQYCESLTGLSGILCPSGSRGGSASSAGRGIDWQAYLVLQKSATFFLQCLLDKPADGFRACRRILLSPAPTIDPGQHRIVQPHDDLDACPRRLGAAASSFLLASTN